MYNNVSPSNRGLYWSSMKHIAPVHVGTAVLSCATRTDTSREMGGSHLPDVTGCMASAGLRQAAWATGSQRIGCHAAAQTLEAETGARVATNSKAACGADSPKIFSKALHRFAVFRAGLTRAPFVGGRTHIWHLPVSHALPGIFLVGLTAYGWSWPVRWRGIKSLPPPCV